MPSLAFKVLALSLPGQGGYSLWSASLPPQHLLYHLGLSLSLGLNEGERAWACSRGAPPRVRGGEAGSASALMQSQPHCLAHFLLFGCLREPGFHRNPGHVYWRQGKQHTKLKLRDKAVLCPPGPHAPRLGTQERDTRCES